AIGGLLYLLAHEGKSLSRIEELSEEDVNLVKQNSVIGSTSFMSKQEILKNIHSKGLWIGCDCMNPSPVVGVRHRDEYYHLFNMNKRGVHDGKCPLHRLPS